MLKKFVFDVTCRGTSRVTVYAESFEEADTELYNIIEGEDPSREENENIMNEILMDNLELDCFNHDLVGLMEDYENE